ncbi:hypothetical protein DFH06DRAFT_1124968 [Mycena polygramma]|nr:hypothetical protein DFH06DRAFT_1124968 [Mycena polygramma]
MSIQVGRMQATGTLNAKITNLRSLPTSRGIEKLNQSARGLETAEVHERRREGVAGRGGALGIASVDGKLIRGNPCKFEETAKDSFSLASLQISSRIAAGVESGDWRCVAALAASTVAITVAITPAHHHRSLGADPAPANKDCIRPSLVNTPLSAVSNDCSSMHGLVYTHLGRPDSVIHLQHKPAQARRMWTLNEKPAAQAYPAVVDQRLFHLPAAGTDGVGIQMHFCALIKSSVDSALVSGRGERACCKWLEQILQGTAAKCTSAVNGEDVCLSPPINTSRARRLPRSSRRVDRLPRRLPPPRSPPRYYTLTGSSARLADLLSRPTQRFAAETQTVPCDVESDDSDGGEDLEIQYGAGAGTAVATGALHPRALLSLAPPTPFIPYVPFAPTTSYTSYTPDTSYTFESALRSRSSASTSGAPSRPRTTLALVLSSGGTSPALLYFRFYIHIHVREIDLRVRAQIVRAQAETEANGQRPQRRNKNNKKKLTVADVTVLQAIVGRPPATSVLASACTLPDVFATPALQTAVTPVPPHSQWAEQPAEACKGRYKREQGQDRGGDGSGCERAHCAERSALRCVYDVAQPAAPGVDISTTLNAGGWSYSSSSSLGHSSPGHSLHSSRSGHSECSVASAGSALRRKPIPVEMFLR